MLSSFGSWDLINPTAFDHHGPTCSALTYALAQRFIHTERPSSTTSLKDRFSQQLDPHDLNTNARKRIKIGTRTANNFSDTAACTANNIGTCTYSTTPARHCCLHRQQYRHMHLLDGNKTTIRSTPSTCAYTAHYLTFHTYLPHRVLHAPTRPHARRTHHVQSHTTTITSSSISTSKSGWTIQTRQRRHRDHRPRHALG